MLELISFYCMYDELEEYYYYVDFLEGYDIK